MNIHIPKVLNTCWPNKDIVNSDHPLITKGIGNFIKINPQWTVKVNTDEEIDQYLKQSIDTHLYKLIENDPIVPKTDIWRLLKLYSEGGMYIDIDRFINTPLDQIINENTKCVLCTSEDYDFSHDIMISAPGNPIFATVIDLYFYRKRQGETRVYVLGPQTYMHGICLALTGQIINTNPGSEVFDELRTKINNTVFLQTYRETFPHDSFVYKGNETLDQWEMLKRDFYKKNNLKHWTGLW